MGALGLWAGLQTNLAQEGVGGGGKRTLFPTTLLSSVTGALESQLTIDR